MEHSDKRRRLRLNALAIAVSLMGMAPLAASAFEAREVEVCPSSAKVYDPEFDIGSQQMAYFDGRDGLRVARVLADGRIDSTNCGGTLVSRGVTISLPELPFKAGPEWALSARGLELYFTKLDRDGRGYMARSLYDGSWRNARIDESQDRGLALVSNDATDPEPRLVYVRTDNAGGYELAWREAGRPETEALLPGRVDPRTGGAPRWVPGRRALSYALPDDNGTLQAVLYDVDTGVVEVLTRDAGNKDEVWLWHAPEFGGGLALMTVVDGCCLRFYRQVNGEWRQRREIKASEFSRRPAIFSPEPFVHDGRSFVAMQLARERVSDSEIWMVELIENGLPPTQLSDPQRRGVNRTEPEWMATPEGVFVYVSASSGSSRFALNRLSTPLSVSAPQRAP